MFLVKKTLVRLNELTNTYEINGPSLVEIKDKKVINRIISVVPEVAQIVGNVAVGAMAAGMSKKGVFQAILPSGAQLVNSKTTEGAVRGFFRNKGKIAGQAEFMPVNESMDKIAAMNIANAAMGAAALVVGQYYMKQINAELESINDSISRLEKFYKNEYKSRVITLVSQLKQTSDFKVEILEDSTLRAEAISKLQTMETTCMDLLNQANVTISEISSGKYEEFEKYIQATSHISEWQKYQMMLVNVLFAIADLNYTFHLGSMSPEYCYRSYEDCFSTTERTIEKIKQWHLFHEKKLGINVNSATYERKGLDAIFHLPLTLINDDFQYKSMKKYEVEKICIQKEIEVSNRCAENKNLYMENARIIFKDGKIFYLPS